MDKSSRRAFLRSIGLPPSAPEPTPHNPRERNESQHDRDETPTSGDAPGTFQFSLMTLFVITTVVGVLLAINKIWPKKSLTVALVAAALAERVYRKRIKATIGARNYEKAVWVLDRLVAVIGGAMLGGFLGLMLSLVAGTVSPAFVGAFVGAIVGLIFPRAVLAICSLIP